MGGGDQAELHRGNVIDPRAGHEDRLLWPEEVAEMLGVPVGTSANRRYLG